MNIENNESFRDHVATIRDDGGRNWVYAKKPRGKYFNYRQVVGYFLLSLFLAGPFIRIKGEPLLLFNLIERRFVFAGQVFQPQDFHLFVLAMLSFIVFIVLFTVVYGRVWCGWACPQTVLMELVFRRIEHFIEGDGPKQRRDANSPMTFGRAIRRTVKHLVFLSLSLLFSAFLTTYITGTERFLELMQEGVKGNAGSYIAFFVFSFAFYGIFSWMREQSCTLICPYGRLQGVLLDPNSLIVAYDHKRGEPREKFKKSQNRNSNSELGHCIDCHRCVSVCPTGIDIRNGTQLECVNCLACADECNDVMSKVGLPKGLIRIDSEKGIEKGEKFKFTARLGFYTAVLSLLLALFLVLVFMRSDVEATVLRTPGTLYQEVEGGKMSNLYNVKLVNKTSEEHIIEFKLLEPEGEVNQIIENILLEPNGVNEGVFFVILDTSLVTKHQLDIVLGMYSDGKKIKEIKSSFVGPIK